MKNIILTLITILLINCSGFETVFSNKNINFHIQKINNLNSDNISRKIIKSINIYNDNSSLKKITIDIKTKKEDRVISKDEKGDPLNFEMKIISNLIIKYSDKSIEKNYTEIFNYKNRSNKFELNQYKRNIINNLTDVIIEKILQDLRTL